VSAEVSRLLQELKRQLKLRSMTYRDLAGELGISEPSVKRLFSSERLTVERLADMARVLGLTLAEISAQAEAAAPRVRALSREQEARIVADPRLLVVAVCALNQWGIDDILAEFTLTRAECLQLLLRLDRMGLIELLPGDRIRARVARDFDWLPAGPIRSYFRAEGQPEFLDAPFSGESEGLDFVHAMLSVPAQQQMAQELRRLRQRFSALHDESLAVPLSDRSAVGLLLATRRWEPTPFRSLRRKRG
jgi:transcriptional regulator with XRE-family HTH domain